jgi:hypothetical protein
MARRSTHRLLDEAKRARAIENARANLGHVRDEREQESGSDETDRQAAATSAKANAMEKASAPRTNALQTAARAQLTPNVNANKGNPREGERFATKKAPGGVRHVYSDGTSVFVRKNNPTRPRNEKTGSPPSTTHTEPGADRRRQFFQQVVAQRQQAVDQRRRKKGVKRTPMVS